MAGADAERAGDTLGYQAVAEAVAGHLHDAGEGLQGEADFDSKAPLLALSAQASLQEAPRSPIRARWTPASTRGPKEARMDSETPISRRPPGLQLFLLQGLAQRSDERLDAGEQAVAGWGQADAAAVCFGEWSADFAFEGGEGDQGFDMGKHIFLFRI